MTWTCPRCRSTNPESGYAVRDPGARDAWGKPLEGVRQCGVECRCGLTRRGWLVGSPAYQYPVAGGYADVDGGRTRVYRAMPQDPNEYTPMEDSVLVDDLSREEFGLTEVPQ